MRIAASCWALLLLIGCPAPPAPDVGPDAGRDAPEADASGLDAASGDAGLDAASGDAGLDAASGDGGCVLSLASIEENLPGLLFTSESDYPLVLEVRTGEGTAPPTPADVARLSGAPLGARTETRDVATFWPRVLVDPTRTPPAPDTRPAMLQAAVEAALSDLAFVRVIDPANPVEVRVFLVGRACGSLVWLASTSIET
jgi:hypothetical protein